MKLEHLLVPVDFSERSTFAINTALELAKLSQGRVTLLHVLEPVVVVYNDAIPGADLVNDADRRYAAEAEMEQLRGRYALEAQLQTMVVDGTAWDGVCSTAERIKSDLIVLTSHGYTGLKRLLLGGTAEKIVRHSKCPVLVLKSFPE